MGRGPSLLTRIRWRAADLWDERDPRVIVGLLVLALLAVGGLAAARAVVHASSASSAQAGVRAVTTRQKVRVMEHGHLVTRWRTRTVYTRGQTVMQTQTIHTPNGTRIVMRPVVRTRVAYRQHVVTVNGKTRTVSQPVTNAQTITNTRTQVVTSTRDVTNQQVTTVTQPVTMVATTTVVSTVTNTLPITVTVTVPTVTVP